MAILFLSSLTVSLAAAGSKPVAGEFALGGPEVVKLDWNTRALQAADLDGDGRQDLLLINNDRARIDLLYQLDPAKPAPAPGRAVSDNRWEPVLENARFRKENLTTGITMFDLAVGDLNGDGRPDLVYTGEPDTLTIRFQLSDGGWSEKQVIDAPAPLQWLSGLKIANLSGDGRNAIVMLAQKELVISRQTAPGKFGSLEHYPLADENCYGLMIDDVDGDGRPDLLYLAPEARDPLRIRLQMAEGGFGPEQSYQIDPVRSTMELLPSADGSVRLVCIRSQTGQLEFLSLPRAAPGAGNRSLRPRVFSSRIGAKTPAAYAFGDFDGDGGTDVAVSDPDGAQILLYLRRPQGGFALPLKFPSLADGRSLAAGNWDGDKQATLFVASPREQSLGMTRLNAEGRLSYPQPLPIKGRPLAVAFGPVKAGGPPALVVAREESGRRLVEVWMRANGAPAVVRSIELPGLKTDPRALRLVDANQDGLTDIAIFVPFEPLRLLIQKEDRQFEEASAAGGFRKGLVDNLEMAALTLGDVDGDGREEMLVAGTGFVRAMRINSQGELTIVDQYNTRESGTEVASALLLPATGPGRPDLLLYDRKGESFQLLRAGPLGVYAFEESVPAGKIELVGAEARRLPDGQTELFFLGKDRFWWLPLGQQDYAPKVVKTYTTDLKDVSYTDVLAGQLSAGRSPELICIDGNLNLIEVLGAGDNSEWHSRMHFKVFETDAHFAGRKGGALEPREAIVADVTGDGRKDLVLLVHNRVLVYPQQ